MASFCRECSLYFFGEDYRDLADLGPPPEEGYGYSALCEDCGFILVDHNGVRLGPKPTRVPLKEDDHG